MVTYAEMSANIRLILLAILASVAFTNGANILLAFEMPGKSHGILADGFVKILLKAGHQVTWITPFLPAKPHVNLTVIDVSSNQELNPTEKINIKKILNKEVDPHDISMFLGLLKDLGNKTYNNENVQKLMMDPSNKFDVVIVEWLFSELGSGLSAVFSCPLIWFSTVEPHWMVTQLIDEKLNPAYNSDSQSGNIPPFTFSQRVEELWKQIFLSLLWDYSFIPLQNEIYEKAFGPAVKLRGNKLPALSEIRYNASLMLGNSHVSLGQPTRLPESYKAIAGYHIDHDVKPLPEDLKQIIESSQNGVIYFSMGSNLRSKDLPDEMKKDLLKMFATLKHTVLWKFEEILPNLPKNVHIIKWAPQQSILAHPNTVLFITHGGLLSITETVHYEVPIVGIPVFADQFINVDRAVQKGFAKRVDLAYDMADHLKVAIADILDSTQYKKKVKELSLIYHDRPVSPDKELVHWVEHVIKTRGALHLRSPALYMTWYQKMYLDLLALIFAVLIAISTIIRRIFCSKKTTTIRKKRD